MEPNKLLPQLEAAEDYTFDLQNIVYHFSDVIIRNRPDILNQGDVIRFFTAANEEIVLNKKFIKDVHSLVISVTDDFLNGLPKNGLPEWMRPFTKILYNRYQAVGFETYGPLYNGYPSIIQFLALTDILWMHLPIASAIAHGQPVVRHTP